MIKKILISVLLFASSAIVSYYCVHSLKKKNAEEPISVNVNLSESDKNNSVHSEDLSVEKEEIDPVNVDGPSKIDVSPSANTPSSLALKLRATNVRETSEGVFSFEATYDGEISVGCHFELWDVSKKVCVASNGDGRFSNIPASTTGLYKLALINDQIGKPVCDALTVRGFKSRTLVVEEKIQIDDVKEKAQKKLITEDELQRKINLSNDHSLDGGKKSVLASGFRVYTRNYNADDEMNLPTDIQDIKDQIIYKRWKRARLISAEYNAAGQVTSITIEPIY